MSLYTRRVKVSRSRVAQVRDAPANIRQYLRTNAVANGRRLAWSPRGALFALGVWLILGAPGRRHVQQPYLHGDWRVVAAAVGAALVLATVASWFAGRRRAPDW